MEKRILFGTWQLGGGFQNISSDISRNLITIALELGITQFDTAAVYGNGSVESMLGEMLPQDMRIVTKVPAVNKPDLYHASVVESYPFGSVKQSVQNSMQRLRREYLDTVLLHNWSRNWVGINYAFEELMELKQRGLVRRIGISLPDDFLLSLTPEICASIDVVEAPLNHVDTWVLSDIEMYKSFGIEVILRSLFAHGLTMKPHSLRATLHQSDPRYKKMERIPFDPDISIETILERVWELETSLVFGASSLEHIKHNVNFLTCKNKES